MTDLQKLKAEVLADGRIEDQEVEVIRRTLYADGRIDRAEVEFLVALRDEAEAVTSSFEQLFYQAVTDYILADGSIDTEEAQWLRALLCADGRIDESEKQLLRDLKAKARQVSPEFQALHDECLQGDPVIDR